MTYEEFFLQNNLSPWRIFSLFYILTLIVFYILSLNAANIPLSLTLIPLSVLTALSFVFPHRIHLLSAIFVVTAIPVPSVMHIFMQQSTQISTSVFVAHLALTAFFMKLKTAFAIPTTFTSAALFFIATYKQSSFQEIFAIVVASVGTIVMAYALEQTSRSSYSADIKFTQINSTLSNQLRGLKSSYESKMVDLDSPLEKAIVAAKSLLCTQLSPHQIRILNIILDCLSSSNLLTPDIYQQLKSGGVLVDDEQQKWLFYEIAARKSFATDAFSNISNISFPISNSKFRRSNSFDYFPRSKRKPSISFHSLPRNQPLNTIAAPELLNQPASNPIKNPSRNSIEFPSNTQCDATIYSFIQKQPLVNQSTDQYDAPSPQPIDPAQTNSSPSSSDHETIQPLQQQQSTHLALTNISTNLSTTTQSNLSKNIQSIVRAGSLDFNPNFNAPELKILSPIPSADTQTSHSFSPITNHFVVSTNIDSLMTDEIRSYLSQTDDYNFPIFEFTSATKNRPLFFLSYHIIVESGLLARLNLPIDKFLNFMAAVEAGYDASLAFHNSIHAADVLHAIYHLSRLERVADVFTDLELLSIFVAACVHDLDHLGVSNNFLIATGHPLARLYNDKSVLENHHCATAFQILSAPPNAFMESLDSKTYRSVRSTIIDMILATDLAHHFALLTTFKKKIVTSDTFDPAGNQEDKHTLMQILMKCADVSNPTKAWHIYQSWIHRITTEFFAQGDREKSLGLPISPFCNRESSHGTHVSSSQQGFIEFIVYPLYEAVEMWTPIHIMRDGLNQSRERFCSQVIVTGSTQQQASVSTTASTLSTGSTGSGGAASHVNTGDSDVYHNPVFMVRAHGLFKRRSSAVSGSSTGNQPTSISSVPPNTPISVSMPAGMNALTPLSGSGLLQVPGARIPMGTHNHYHTVHGSPMASSSNMLGVPQPGSKPRRSSFAAGFRSGLMLLTDFAKGSGYGGGRPVSATVLEAGTGLDRVGSGVLNAMVGDAGARQPVASGSGADVDRESVSDKLSGSVSVDVDAAHDAAPLTPTIVLTPPSQGQNSSPSTKSKLS